MFPFATNVNDTNGAPWAANISANFWKKSKRPFWDTQGLEGNWFMKKTWSRKSRGNNKNSRRSMRHKNTQEVNKTCTNRMAESWGYPPFKHLPPGGWGLWNIASCRSYKLISQKIVFKYLCRIWNKKEN